MFLSRIVIYPIKSLDGVGVTSARITSAGTLEHDRVYAIMDADGRVVNGKRTDRVHHIRCEYSEDFTEVCVRTAENPQPISFAFVDPEPLEAWLGRVFDFPVRLAVSHVSGFPDDTTASGPTLTSEASLEEVAKWFPELPFAGIPARFRANLELGGCEAFAEDRLFGPEGESKSFRIGDVRLLGHNPCQRCVVPTRDPLSGERAPAFQKRFAEKREESLPAWAARERFDHYYRFALNTTVPPSEAEKILTIGAPIEID
ncbi:MAG TPA: MOSC N-terminal beta barrel domain-containing protein [Chthoniobacterales bacterium]